MRPVAWSRQVLVAGSDQVIHAGPEPRRQVRRREIGYQLLHQRIDPGSGYAIAWKRLVVIEWIDDRFRQQLGEISSQLLRTWNSALQYVALSQPLGFIVCEIKRPVLSDWAANSGAELVESKTGRTRTRPEKLTGLKHPVPRKFVNRAVQRIGAGLRDH